MNIALLHPPSRPYPFVSLAFLFLLCLFSTSANAALPFSGSSDVSSSIYFCKCICFSNYTILPLYRPADPAKPCLSCTKQFCLDQKLPICKDATMGDVDPDTATGEEGDVQTKCFQRDSALSYYVVVVFIILTSGLLAGAALKERVGEKRLQAHALAVYERFRVRRPNRIHYFHCTASYGLSAEPAVTPFTPFPLPERLKELEALDTAQLGLIMEYYRIDISEEADYAYTEGNYAKLGCILHYLGSSLGKHWKKRVNTS